MKISNNTYDTLKWIAQILLPALAVFVIAFNGLWNIPNQDSIAGTIMAVDAFLGALLGISSKGYSDGDLHVVTDPSDGGTAVQVATNHVHPAELKQGQTVMLKVNKVAA